MKPILVFYVDVGSMPSQDVSRFIEQMIVKLKDKETIQYFVPVRGESTHVECIYPKFLVINDEMKDEIEVLEQTINQLSKSLTEVGKIILPS